MTRVPPHKLLLVVVSKWCSYQEQLHRRRRPLRGLSSGDKSGEDDEDDDGEKKRDNTAFKTKTVCKLDETVYEYENKNSDRQICKDAQEPKQETDNPLDNRN